MARFGAVGLGVFANALIGLTSAHAAATSFDCDVPPDHFSSVSQDIIGPMMISGSIQLVQMRSGNNLPVAGARLVSSDGKDAVGFQLVASSARAKKFDIVFNIKRGDDLQRNTVGQVAVDPDAPVSFSLVLDNAGKATLTVGGGNFSASFTPLPGGKEMAFCSTAQFKFAGLLFSPSDAANTTVPHQ